MLHLITEKKKITFTFLRGVEHSCARAENPDLFGKLVLKTGKISVWFGRHYSDNFGQTVVVKSITKTSGVSSII